MSTITVISGGQTGADQGALQAAYELGIKTGGYIIKNYGTEKGPMPELAKYGLVCLNSNDYVARTALNAQKANITIWIGPGNRTTESRGFLATKRECLKAGCTFEICTGMSPQYIAGRLSNYMVGFFKKPEFIINVAGNRESSSPGLQQQVYETMKEALTLLKECER